MESRATMARSIKNHSGDLTGLFFCLQYRKSTKIISSSKNSRSISPAPSNASDLKPFLSYRQTRTKINTSILLEQCLLFFQIDQFNCWNHWLVLDEFYWSVIRMASSKTRDPWQQQQQNRLRFTTISRENINDMQVKFRVRREEKKRKKSDWRRNEQRKQTKFNRCYSFAFVLVYVSAFSLSIDKRKRVRRETKRVEPEKMREITLLSLPSASNKIIKIERSTRTSPNNFPSPDWRDRIRVMASKKQLVSESRGIEGKHPPRGFNWFDSANYKTEDEEGEEGEMKHRFRVQSTRRSKHRFALSGCHRFQIWFEITLIDVVLLRIWLPYTFVIFTILIWFGRLRNVRFDQLLLFFDLHNHHRHHQ